MTAPLSASTVALFDAPLNRPVGSALESEPTGRTTPRVCGLDLAMTATGVCTDDGAFTIKPKSDGDLRLLEIRDAVYDACAGADLVVIEDLPNHAKGAGITGRVQGIVRLTLLDAKIPYVLVVASSLKKYATGSGNADKVAMGVAAMKRFGLEFKTSDGCDAFWLRAMALDALGFPLSVMPAVSRGALDAVAWPEIGRWVA